MAVANCAIDTAFSGVSCADRGTPGMKTYAYFANFDEITGWTGSGSVNTAVTFASGAGFYRVEIKKDSGRFHETLQNGDSDLTSYDQDYEFMIASLASGARDFIDGLNGPNMVCFLPSKDENVYVIGKENGVKMVENEADTNTDSYGERVILRATQSTSKREYLLVTDFDGTISYLEANAVAS